VVCSVADAPTVCCCCRFSLHCRRTLRRTIKKSAMLWIRVTPNVPVTSKPAEVRVATEQLGLTTALHAGVG
jgi:ribosomal protein L16/L10AE